MPFVNEYFEAYLTATLESSDVGLPVSVQATADLLELLHIVVDHVGDVAKAHAADALDVSGVAYAGASDGHCLAHVYLAGVEETAHDGQHLEIDGPDQVTLVDGADVVDLHAYVSGGVRSVEDVELDSGQLVERSAGMCPGAEPEMDFRCNFGQNVDGGLNISHFVFQNKIIVSCEWS